MKRLFKDSRAVGKVTLTFTSLIVVLFLSVIILGVIMSDRIDALQSDNSSLQGQVGSLQASNTQLQTSNSQLQKSYNNLQSQFNQLNSSYQQLLSSNNTSETPRISDLENQIAILEEKLANATTRIAQLQGQTGILPSYSNLGWDGYSYILQLSLQNTGTNPVTGIFVTLNSVQTNMTFTYLNTTINENSSLPAYQTATGRFTASPTAIRGIGTYPLVIQAVASNGTIYTYQTTITAHI